MEGDTWYNLTNITLQCFKLPVIHLPPSPLPPPPPPPSLLSPPSPLQETLALRGGRYISVPVEQLVVGDMVEVKFGDRVPADIRIITASSFKVTGHTV